MKPRPDAPTEGRSTGLTRREARPPDRTPRPRAGQRAFTRRQVPTGRPTGPTAPRAGPLELTRREIRPGPIAPTARAGPRSRGRSTGPYPAWTPGRPRAREQDLTRREAPTGPPDQGAGRRDTRLPRPKGPVNGPLPSVMPAATAGPPDRARPPRRDPPTKGPVHRPLPGVMPAPTARPPDHPDRGAGPWALTRREVPTGFPTEAGPQALTRRADRPGPIAPTGPSTEGPVNGPGPRTLPGVKPRPEAPTGPDHPDRGAGQLVLTRREVPAGPDRLKGRTPGPYPGRSLDRPADRTEGRAT